MIFINKDFSGTWQLEEYLKYLQEVRDNLPPNAREFAFMEGHYDISHPNCPHDSWVEFISVRELSEGDRNEIRALQINAKFLNSHHNGFFEITYENVQEYSLNLKSTHRNIPTNIEAKPIGHGDWIIDEILIEKSGYVSHEIEFSDSGHWKIICGDIIYRQLPVTH